MRKNFDIKALYIGLFSCVGPFLWDTSIKEWVTYGGIFTRISDSCGKWWALRKFVNVWYYFYVPVLFDVVRVEGWGELSKVGNDNLLFLTCPFPSSIGGDKGTLTGNFSVFQIIWLENLSLFIFSIFNILYSVYLYLQGMMEFFFSIWSLDFLKRCFSF